MKSLVPVKIRTAPSLVEEGLGHFDYINRNDHDRLYWFNIGIVEKKMETPIMGLITPM